MSDIRKSINKIPSIINRLCKIEKLNSELFNSEKIILTVDTNLDTLLTPGEYIFEENLEIFFKDNDTITKYFNSDTYINIISGDINSGNETNIKIIVEKYTQPPNTDEFDVYTQTVIYGGSGDITRVFKRVFTSEVLGNTDFIEITNNLSIGTFADNEILRGDGNDGVQGSGATIDDDGRLTLQTESTQAQNGYFSVLSTVHPSLDRDFFGVEMNTSGQEFGVQVVSTDQYFQSNLNGQGKLNFESYNGSGLKLSTYGGSDKSIQFAPNRSVAATIIENGNIGIGTTTPTEKLEVSGEVKATVSGVTHKLSEKTNQSDFEKYFKFQNWKNTISGGGDITWSGNNLSTSNRLIVIPTNANNGYIQINLTNLSVSGWRIAYIDLTDTQLRQGALTLTQDDFTVEVFTNYTEATSQNRFVLGYCNGDTGEFIFSNGLSVENMNYRDSGWIKATYQNGWVSFGSSYQIARYKKIGSVVYVEGLVKNGTINKPIFTLPAGFRPAKRIIIPSISADNIARLDILTDGRLIPVNGSSGWVSVNCSFAV